MTFVILYVQNPIFLSVDKSLVTTSSDHENVYDPFKRNVLKQWPLSFPLGPIDSELRYSLILTLEDKIKQESGRSMFFSCLSLRDVLGGCDTFFGSLALSVISICSFSIIITRRVEWNIPVANLCCGKCASSEIDIFFKNHGIRNVGTDCVFLNCIYCILFSFKELKVTHMASILSNYRMRKIRLRAGDWLAQDDPSWLGTAPNVHAS